MYQRKRRKQVAEINVVPYIDVMLVLLLIFMATAPLITQGVKVDLPQASAKPLSEEASQPLIVTVDIDGLYYANVGANEERPLSVNELAAIVRSQLAQTPDKPVMVRGDQSVAYAEVVQLMVLLQQAGAPSVGLVTDQPVKR